MSEEYFENPEDFLPERWLQGAHDPPTQRLMGLCVLPFGLGKRNCLGRRFAEQEIHLAAIKVRAYLHVIPVYMCMCMYTKSPYKIYNKTSATAIHSNLDLSLN